MLKLGNLAVAAATTAALVLPVSGAVILATPVPAEAKKSKKDKDEDKPKTEIKAGTEIKGQIEDALSSATAEDGDTFTVKCSSGWIFNKKLKGCTINGHVEGVKKAKMGSKSGEMDLVFDELETADGKTIPLDAELTQAPKAKGKFLTKAAIVMGGAIAGHHLGKKTGKKHGALMGAAAATAVALTMKGGDVEIKSGSEIKLKLKDDISF